MADTKDLTIQQGKTFTLVLRWETYPIVRKAITAISLDTGAPRLTVSTDNFPDGWRGAITMVKGMTEINSKNSPPKESDYEKLTVVGPNTVELNEVTPVSESGRDWSVYISGGYLQHYTPVELTGYTARMKIKDKVGGTVLASTEAGDSPLDVLDITINNTTKQITLTIAATDTDDFTWTKGVYDLEMVSATGVVTTIMSGKVVVTKEVTV